MNHSIKRAVLDFTLLHAYTLNMENESILSLSEILEETARKMLCMLADSRCNDKDSVTRYYASLIQEYHKGGEIITSIDNSTKVFLDRIGIGHYVIYRFSDQNSIQSPYVVINKTSLPEKLYKDGNFIEYLISS